MSTQIQTLKGFRDFLPQEKRARDFVLQKVKEVFERFGFEPLETPTLEYAELLLGKYGDEADKLVYQFEDRGERKIALRYDQTVPTARVLAQYQNDLPKFFRRYQIQNVFRADKPQKGRYREFTQCDIDIFNSRSPISDAEILACTYFAFANVGYPTIILKVNDRKTLFEILSPFATTQVDVFSIIQSIDKLDKTSEAEVVAELVRKGLGEDAAKEALNKIKFASLSQNLAQIIENTKALGVPEAALSFSPYLARGLDYYTGMIFEVILPEYQLGSFGGGGRYDNLINQLGGIDIPAVGIAFGFDRMVEAATKLELIKNEHLGTQILVTIFNPDFLTQSLATAKQLREQGIRTEVFPDGDTNLGKQFKYANKKGIPHVVVIGEAESKQGKVQLKNMQSGEQGMMEVNQVIEKLKIK